VRDIEKCAPEELADPDHFAVRWTPASSFFQDENDIPSLRTVPIHLLPVKTSTYRNPRYADNATIRKWRLWVDMQETYLENDRIRPIPATE
jgi:hypothetical protein